MFAESSHCLSLFRQEREGKGQRIPSLGFDYDTPYPGFDRSKVKGLVASLISLKPADYDKATALEITAGGRLYNVIVQDPQVGQDLIDKGRLRKRVTIIPLNGIRERRLSPQASHQQLMIEFVTNNAKASQRCVAPRSGKG